MSLQLNASNSLLQLVEHLSHNLRKPLTDVFQPHYIITQTKGMNNWLKVQLSDRLGIVANCQFFKPNDIVNHLYYLLDGPRDHILSVDSLQWLLYGLLDETNFKKRFPFISKYYDGQVEIKRMTLAEKIADLFDQYQIYRPEMINEWNELQFTVDDQSNWQKYLWIEVKDRVGGKMPDKTKVGRHIIDSLKNPVHQKKLEDLIPKVDFFGISIITAYHLEIFQELARYVDVSFHLLNPAPSIYWFDDKSPSEIARWKNAGKLTIQDGEDFIEGNPLLTNWGRVVQDTFGLFFKDDSFLNEYDDSGIEPYPTTLLAKIQHDIYNNSVLEERNVISIANLNDGSVSINSCYTIVREVEVLYNYLVHLVNSRPNNLSARDIVVMVSDIDAYAPYIKGIFTSAPYKLPFSIADESMQTQNGLVGALSALFDLTEENFTAENVLQLLDWEYIKNRFALSDATLIRKVVNDANVRFGIEGNLSDDTVHVSWMNGIHRIMYGICMVSDDEYQSDSYRFYPMDRVEGDESLELIRFSHFVTVLSANIRDRYAERTLVEWGDYILSTVSNIIYQSEDDDNEHFQLLADYVKKINVISENVPEKVGFDVFKHSFLNNLSLETRSGNFASGGITFCSLIPMRSIPFKVVAVLGLGFDKFPRKEVPLNFNLMQLKAKRGDRNIKDNDKHLFLETILSAQEHLYLSYIGKSSKDNSLLPPSAIVDELIDYIASGTDLRDSLVRKQLTKQHPLHNFTKQPDGVLNYLSLSDKETIATDRFLPSIKEVDTLQDISIQHLINFFKNPFQHYHNSTLNISYREDDVLLRDTEYFELDALNEWQIKQDLLYIAEEDLDEYRRQGVQKGTLPLKNMSKTILATLNDELDPIRKLVGESIGNREEGSIAVDLLIRNTRITGKLNRIYGDRLVSVSFSKNNNKNILEAYLKHLLAFASGYSLESHLILGLEKTVYKIGKDSLNQEKALQRLEELMYCFHSGCERPFVFYPRFENDPTKLAKFSFTSYQTMLKKIFNNDEYPCDDQYVVNEYNSGFFDCEEVFQEYITNSELVFSEAFTLFKV